MSVILDCSCVFCNYRQVGMRLGSEKMMGYHYFPAFQAMEKTLVQLNIFRYLEIEEFRLPEEKNEELIILKSLKIIPYFETSMFEQNGHKIEILSEVPRLQSSHNYCPRCGKFGLQFKIA